jgi:hypothetical protein
VADFAAGWNGTAGIGISANTGTQSVPVWTALNNSGSAGANELRWSLAGTIANNTTNGTWPSDSRPGAVTQFPYLYAYTADNSGSGVLPASAPPNLPTAFVITNFFQLRVGWDGAGTFASPPILTGYGSSAHGAITRGDGTIIGGGNPDTGAVTQRSYLKGNLYGANTAAMPAAPSAGPVNAPAATDGVTGANPAYGASAAWLTNFQALTGDLDYIQYSGSPTALVAAVLYFMLALFTGPNMAVGVFTPDFPATKYSYT